MDTSDYTRRLVRLVEVCRSLSANLEPQPLLQYLIEVGAELTACEYCAFLAVEPDAGSLRFISAPWFKQNEMRRICLPVHESAAGQAFLSGSPVVIHDAASDSRIYRVVDAELGIPTRSILAVPVAFRGQSIGVLIAVNKLGGQDYLEEDIFILETLAAQAAMAYQTDLHVRKSREAYERVLEMDRTKSDLVAMLSHELRTPLGVVLGHALMLQETADPDSRRTLDTMIDSANRLKEIIEEFATIDQLDVIGSNLHLTSVALDRLAWQVVESFQPLAHSRGVMLEMFTTKGSLVIQGDRGRLQVAIRNLIKNALMFTNSSGRVVVRVEEVPGYVRVSVTDTGIGIPPAEQEKIFQRFYQVEKHLTRRHGGMGLGLSIARDMVECHGGKILVESVEGRGSRFTILLPQNQAQAAAAGKVFTED